MYEPYIVNISSIGTTTPGINFWLPTTYLEECFGLGEWTFEFGPAPSTPSITVADLYSYEKEVGPGLTPTGTGSSVFGVFFDTTGTKTITVTLNREGVAPETCEVLTKVFTFDTEAIPRYDETICDILNSACTPSNLDSALILEQFSPTEIQLTFDPQSMIDDGCFDGETFYFDIRTDADVNFSEVYNYTDGDGGLITTIIPAFATGSDTTITFNMATGPNIPIIDAGGQPLTWVPMTCELDDYFTKIVDIGTLPPASIP